MCTSILLIYSVHCLHYTHSENASFLFKQHVHSSCTHSHSHPVLWPRWKNWPLPAPLALAPLAGLFTVIVRPDMALSSCFVCASMARVSQSAQVKLDTAGTSRAMDDSHSRGLFFFLPLPAACCRYCLSGGRL